MKNIKEKGFLSNMSSHESLVEVLLELPHKISYHRDRDIDGLAQMVLYEIAHGTNLDLRKVSFFVDNPDFDCLKGVAGYARDENAENFNNDPWQEPHSFIQSLEKSDFYATVKNFLKHNVERADKKCSQEELTALGNYLGMKSPQIHTWQMRHGNHGVLIFEEGDKQICRKLPGVLDKISALLGLCSV